ncbi:MAG: cache domain-containing protein [ANME-2 cluster archaeon]|nr:cache domain-containing protein [ANME-2 cluster archaeon]
MEKSISTKLAYAFLVILFASFLIAGGVGVYLFNNMIQDNIQHDVVHDLDAAEVIYQTHLTNTEEIVEYTSGFSRIRDPLIYDNSTLLRQNLIEIYNERFSHKLDILTVTDMNGTVIARARNPDVFGDNVAENILIRYALNGSTVSSTEIITREELLMESQALADQAYMEFTPTPKAKERLDDYSTSGMVLMAATPIYDDDGNMLGVLYGADLINRDYRIVDIIKDALYKGEVYGGRDMGTATIFQEDFRISTNVPTDTDKRAITTRVSKEVNEAVLERGEYWKDRAFVVNAWYVTAYKPIYNFNGDIIGILYVGILEKPYIDAGYRILWAYLGFLFVGFVLSMFISRYYARSITRPINKLIKGTESMAKGEFTEIHVDTKDEIEKLANSFNAMAKELQHTMAELISSKKEIETIFESISDVASAQDTDMKIIFANKLAKDLYGEDIIGQFCYEVYEGKSEVCDDCPAVISLETGVIMRTIHTKSNEEGVTSYYEISGSPLRDEQDNITGQVMIRRDVTEQMTLEIELRESYEKLGIAYEELQQLDRMKSELIANISHEIRTPLTSIKGYTELMQDGTLGHTTNMQRKGLSVVQRNVDRLTRLISNVLDLSKYDQIEYKAEVVKLKEIIDNVIADFTKIASDKHISITSEVREELTLEADVYALEQVFKNLIENTIKFTDKGGKVSIKAYSEDNYHIHIEVRDTGIGIPDNEFERVFDRFYQVDASSTRKYGGTGLGLAISKKIVEWHKGTIWVRNNEVDGMGSVFHIILPVNH